MKAKRKSASGGWRIIPGNHPQDKVYIELPVEDLPDRPPDVSAVEIAPAKPRPQPQADSGGAIEASLSLIASLQDRVNALSDQLFEVMDARRAEAGELASARIAAEEAAARAEAAARREQELHQQLDEALSEMARIQKESAARRRPFSASSRRVLRKAGSQ